MTTTVFSIKKVWSHAVFMTVFSLFNSLFAQNTYSASEAIDHVGEYAYIKGKVYQVYISKKGHIFLNMDGQYPNQPFTAVIFQSDAYKFNYVKSLENKTIVVKGIINLYKNKPEIILKNPEQLSTE
jgi:hypothetical protein